MQRLQRLDGIRGLLALYVMLGHALPLTVSPAWLSALCAHGEAAVDLFFALSGLVIAGSLERYSGRFWPFMAARAWRLLPVYFLVLGFSILAEAKGDPLPALPWAGEAARQIISPRCLTRSGLISWRILPCCMGSSRTACCLMAGSRCWARPGRFPRNGNSICSSGCLPPGASAASRWSAGSGVSLPASASGQ